jgi:predicted aldo/keto reductase-like oxidoreductase
MLPLPHLDLAMRYALAVPGVVSLNIGVHNVDQVRKNVTMAKNCQPLTANEKKKLVSLGKELSAQWGSHFGPVARLAVDNCGHC